MAEKITNDTSGSNEPVLFMPQTLLYTTDGVRLGFKCTKPDTVSMDEARNRIAGFLGADPSKVHLKSSSDEPRVAKNSFGFSNWAGSKWEPAGPPKADPNLN